MAKKTLLTEGASFRQSYMAHPTCVRSAQMIDKGCGVSCTTDRGLPTRKAGRTSGSHGQPTAANLDLRLRVAAHTVWSGGTRLSARAAQRAL